MRPVYSLRPRRQAPAAVLNWGLGLCCLGASWPLAVQAADPVTTAAVARCRSDPTADDCRLTVAAMKSLAADARLAPLNLGLTVHGHRITLWGFVPSRELARLAEKRLLDVPGVGQVMNQLQVQPLPEPVRSSPPPRTGPIGVPAPDGPLPLERPLLLPPDVQRNSQPALADLLPAQGVLTPIRVVARPVITNTEPPLAVLPPAARPTPAASERAIADLLRSDSRYQQLRARIQGGVVALYGNAFSWDDLRLVATAIARVPGVQRVLLDEVRVAAR